MTKEECRAYHLGLRKSMSRKDVLRDSQRITGHIVDFLKNKEIDVLFSYMAFRNEVEIEPSLINVVMAMPQVVSREKMIFRTVDKQTVYRTSAYGVSEPISGDEVVPTTASVMLVPGSVFDQGGNRIGYGGGYYDRYLNRYPSAFKIGVCYSHQLIESLVADGHDVKMDAVLTEQGFLYIHS